MFKGACPKDTNYVGQIHCTNPIRYAANYFGHKLHIDQNEKLAGFGVTHVLARDGYSGKVVSFLTLPVKNNVAIYDEIFRYTYVIGSEKRAHFAQIMIVRYSAI